MFILILNTLTEHLALFEISFYCLMGKLGGNQMPQHFNMVQFNNHTLSAVLPNMNNTTAHSALTGVCLLSHSYRCHRCC